MVFKHLKKLAAHSIRRINK